MCQVCVPENKETGRRKINREPVIAVKHDLDNENVKNYKAVEGKNTQVYKVI